LLISKLSQSAGRIAKASEAVGKIHSDPFALIDSHFVLLALEAPRLHQRTSFAAQRLPSAYQEFERLAAVSKTALEHTVALL
jgi:hypothetical protein